MSSSVKSRDYHTLSPPSISSSPPPYLPLIPLPSSTLSPPLFNLLLFASSLILLLSLLLSFSSFPFYPFSLLFYPLLLSIFFSYFHPTFLLSTNFSFFSLSSSSFLFPFLCPIMRLFLSSFSFLPSLFPLFSHLSILIPLFSPPLPPLPSLPSSSLPSFLFPPLPRSLPSSLPPPIIPLLSFSPSFISLFCFLVPFILHFFSFIQ